MAEERHGRVLRGVALVALCGVGMLTACRSPQPARPDDQQQRANAGAAADEMPELEVREEFYEDGTLARQVTGYIGEDGEFVQHGALVNYWPNGQKKSELHFVHGVRHGSRRAWYQNGQLWSEGEFVNGREHGTWTVWYPEGRKAQEINFDNGAYDGPYREWYPNGQLRKEFTYVQGKKQGVMRTWDEQGNLGEEVEYVDDVPQP